MLLRKILLKRFIGHAKLVRDFLLNLLFPLFCLSCTKEGAWLCSSCEQKLHWQNDYYCPNCKQINHSGKYCQNCFQKHYLAGVWIAGDYQYKIIKNLIKKYKYGFAVEIGDILGNFLCNYWQHSLIKNKMSRNIIESIFNNESKPLLIPVPLHKKRQAWRGFNQAELLAKKLANLLGWQVSHSLKRQKYTHSQTKLSKKERIKNVKNSFQWLGTPLEKRPILLLDDVITSGATLNECARVLQRSDAGVIWSIVVAQN